VRLKAEARTRDSTIDENRELGFCCESCGLSTGGAASAGDVSARTKIVVVGEAVSADVHVMNPAMNHGSFGSAEVAAAADTLGSFRGAGCRSIAPGGSRFYVEPSRPNKTTQGEYANSKATNTLIRVRTERSGKKGEAN